MTKHPPSPRLRRGGPAFARSGTADTARRLQQTRRRLRGAALIEVIYLIPYCWPPNRTTTSLEQFELPASHTL